MEKLSELGEQAYAEFEKEFETDIMITVERFKKAAQKVAGKELKRSMRDVLQEEMEKTHIV